MTHPHAALPLVLALSLGLAACGAKTPSDPADAQIARLVSQGFRIVSDGRDSGAPTALQYDGTPLAVITCAPPGGRAGPTDLAGSATSADGRFTVAQTGAVDAYVIVAPDGQSRGVYVTSVQRSVAASGGAPVAKQVEKIEFPPGGAGQFRNGVTCQPKG